MSANLPLKVRERLDQHLDEVDTILREQAMARSERTVILDELTDQVLEMLAGETSPERATPADLDAVFGRLDPPVAYATKERPARDGTDPATTAMSEPALSTLAVLAFILSIAALVFPWLGIALGGRMAVAFSGLSLLLAIAAPILGFLAIEAIKNTQPRPRGARLAIFAAIFTPALFILLASTGLVLTMLLMALRRSGFSEMLSWLEAGILGLPCLVVGTLMAAGYARFALRYARSIRGSSWQPASLEH